MPVPCSGVITLNNLCVTVDATKQVAFRTLQQQYGDGYVARRQDGVNPVMETWNVSTPTMPVEDVINLENELIALGTRSFGWTPPNETVEKQWILDPVVWNWTYSSGDKASLSFTLKRWYR